MRRARGERTLEGGGGNAFPESGLRVQVGSWVPDQEDGATDEELARDWEQRRAALPLLAWMLFVFVGCAVTNYRLVFGPDRGPQIPGLDIPPQLRRDGGRMAGESPGDRDGTWDVFEEFYKDGASQARRKLASPSVARPGAGLGPPAVGRRKPSFKRPLSGWLAKSRGGRPRGIGVFGAAGSRPVLDKPKGTSRKGSGRTNAAPKQNKDDAETRARRAAVRDAFRHAWRGYEVHAFGHDEVRPTTNATNDSWGGFGVTLFDSLDTMIIMGLEDEYQRALRHVYRVSFDKDYEASFFETAIRYLGGMLGAHALSPDPMLRDKARDLGERLLASFQSTPSGLPQSVVNLRTGHSHNHKWNGAHSILSEVGSIQLEFAYLSQITGDSRFHDAARAVFSLYSKSESPLGGLFPVYMDPRTREFATNHVTMGGLSDSFYEYLLKLYILTGQSDTDVLAMYNKAIQSMREHLVFDAGDGISFLAEHKGRPIKEMEHLSCFVPGMLALGASLFNGTTDSASLAPAERELASMSGAHRELAHRILNGCVLSYDRMPSGLAPERFAFEESEPIYNRIQVREGKYILRPETVESVFVMYRVTGDKRYREMGWKIFKAIEKHCRVKCCYSGIKDVSKPDNEIELNNSMQSFFLAETLKYLYLLFSDDGVIPLDKYVFTTEAHPLPVFKPTFQRS